MHEPNWLDEAIAKKIHEKLISNYGGKAGVLHPLRLKSSLDRPQNILNYKPDSTIFELAAYYGYAFIKNHCFVDGNKRVGLAAIDVFLRLNGYQLLACPSATTALIVKIAGSVPSEETEVYLTEWIKSNAIVCVSTC